MIGKLKGIVDEIGEDSLILDVGGVGYHVFVSQRLLTAIEGTGAALNLFIETQMREDAIRLFGFINRFEQEWFRLLQQVQGVGAKVALALLGTLGTAQIADAIALKDVAQLTRAPGVGKKVAERMITELKGKVGVLASSNFVDSAFMTDQSGQDVPTAGADALSALVNLGYGRAEAAQAVAQAFKQLGEGADSASLIRVGLQLISRS